MLKHLALAVCSYVATAQVCCAETPVDAQRAQQNYQLHCMGCHAEDGMGQAGKVPPIRSTLAQILAARGGREYVLRVPGVAQSSLGSRDLAGVLNWLVNEYAAPTAGLCSKCRQRAPGSGAADEQCRPQCRL
jgi:mono/diheme cytochrome c family protein